jgi:hypothetical protein
VGLQIINTFSDSVMSVCLTKTEIIGGSVDGTVRTFDMRIGRYVELFSDVQDIVCISCYFLVCYFFTFFFFFSFVLLRTGSILDLIFLQ